MTFKTHTTKGFIALISVILLASGTIAFSLAALSGAVWYSDAVDKRELRIQAGLNAGSCLESAVLIAAKDYFLNGTTTVFDLGCEAAVSRDGNDLFIETKAILHGVTGRAKKILSGFYQNFI